jgi:hypothetical protein
MESGYSNITVVQSVTPALRVQFLPNLPKQGEAAAVIKIGLWQLRI